VLHAALAVHLFLLHRLRDERGQTSAEYALVLLGVAAIALLVGLWAKNTDVVGKLLDTIFGSIMKMAKG
jgi:Flp pilus assembly pilin Flp